MKTLWIGNNQIAGAVDGAQWANSLIGLKPGTTDPYFDGRLISRVRRLQLYPIAQPGEGVWFNALAEVETEPVPAEPAWFAELAETEGPEEAEAQRRRQLAWNHPDRGTGLGF